MWMALIGISARSSRIAFRVISVGVSMSLFFSYFDNLLIFHFTEIILDSVPKECLNSLLITLRVKIHIIDKGYPIWVKLMSQIHLG